MDGPLADDGATLGEALVVVVRQVKDERAAAEDRLDLVVNRRTIVGGPRYDAVEFLVELQR